MRVPFATPATPRERIAAGVWERPSIRMASGIPGISRSKSGAVASGVTSRELSPVPPAVKMTSTVPICCSRTARMASSSSGACARCTSQPWATRAAAASVPALSSRSPAWIESLTVSTRIDRGVSLICA